MKYFVEKEDFIFNTRKYIKKYVMTIMILKRKR